MFKKTKNRQLPKKNNNELPTYSKTQINTIIGRSTTIEGNIHFIGVLKIDGMVKGNVKAEGEKSILIINEEGRIQGNIEAPNIMINGSIEGTVHVSKKAELFQQAKILGDLHYNLLEMEVGSTVNGKLINIEQKNKTVSKTPPDNKNAADSF